MLSTLRGMEHPFDADEILPGLWQGALPPLGGTLSEMGFDVVVLSAANFQYPSVYFPGTDVIHAPLWDDDTKPVDRTALQTAVRAAVQVTQARKSGKKVLVTCRAGMNRSGLITGIAIHLLTGAGGDKAVELIRARRTWPENYMPLTNMMFVEALRRLK